MSAPEKRVPRAQLPPLDPLIEGYLSYLLNVGRKTPRTVVDVRCTLRRAAEHFVQDAAGTPLWHLTFEQFLSWIETERRCGRTSASLAKYLSHVRGFLEYAWRSGRTTRNVLDGFQLKDGAKHVAPNFLTLEEAARLIGACPRATPLERRDRLLILLLYGCGLRTHELCSLDIGDINRERQELIVQHGKGDRARAVPIPDGVYSELLAHLLEQDRKRGALIRTAHLSRRIRDKDVCEIVAAAAQRAGLPRSVTARTLRHTFATHLMDRGVDLAVIASLMGHRSPQETGVYLHVLPERPRAAVNALTAVPGTTPSPLKAERS
jgi:site-specific recombinase XerD